MKIGVFDSGVGGLSVANAIQKALPGTEVIYRNDKEHVPYGTRQPEEIFQLITPIFQAMIDEGCEIIVVACNTISTTLMKELHQGFSVPFITVEPLVKLAASLTKTDIIAVCATPTTLASARYNLLKAIYADEITVLEPDCSDWSYMIVHRRVDQMRIARRIEQVITAGADVIVLGCTHYHWIEAEITRMAQDKAVVIQPEKQVISQLKQVIAQRS